MGVRTREGRGSGGPRSRHFLAILFAMISLLSSNPKLKMSNGSPCGEKSKHAKKFIVEKFCLLRVIIELFSTVCLPQSAVPPPPTFCDVPMPMIGGSVPFILNIVIITISSNDYYRSKICFF